MHRFIEEELLTESGLRENIAQEREARDAADAQLAAQRERDAATKAALIRARKAATVCRGLAAAAFGFNGMRQAQSTRAMAETARSESERLIVYLLDDFYGELEPVGRLEIVGDLAMVRERARGVREGLLAVDLGQDRAQRRLRANELRRLHWTLGRLETESDDFGAAEQHLQWAAKALREIPQEALGERRDHADVTALWALALGRLDEARPKAAEALGFQRELHARAGDDEIHKRDLALALVASAWVEPGRARGLLDEAQAAVDPMPPDARALRYRRWVASLIADARRSLR